MLYTIFNVFDFLEKIYVYFEFVKLSPEMEKDFQSKRQKDFNKFFRHSLIFGFGVYIILIVWDYFLTATSFQVLIALRVSMLLFIAAIFLISYHKKFVQISQYIGAIFILILMLNITWTQSVIENNLDQSVGMLITPGLQTSVIVFSGAEIGYGALLTPLLLLPIGFSAPQAFTISFLTILLINTGMHQSELPEAFVYTINSVFIGIGLFTTVLAFLINQQRRKNFLLEAHLLEAMDDALFARQHAEKASQNKSDLLATMSHEVRNFVTGIIAVSEKLQTIINDKEPLNFVKTLHYSGEALLVMLNDLLDWSKIEAGKMELEYTQLDLRILVNSVIDLIKTRAQEKNIQIIVEIDESIPYIIQSDPTRLRQVLLNLISNAIKFTHQGFIKIELSKLNYDSEENTVGIRFKIEDTGIGISEDSQKLLFLEYVQADKSTTRNYGGTGLGLNICKKIVNLMGADIYLKSEENKGSCFWFDLSFEIIEHNDLAQDKIAPTYISTQPLNILLVEDDKLIARYMIDLLETENHNVHHANSGHNALNNLNETIFDLVLMDYNMPELNGLETTKLIRSSKKPYSQVPIIALTANIDEKVINSLKDAGINAYLQKPPNKHLLFQCLSEYGYPSNSTAPYSLNNNLDILLDNFGEEYVSELLKDFITGIEDKIENLSKALSNEDREAIASNAHDICGISGTVGLLKSSSLFSKLENSVQSNSFKDLNILFERCCDVFANEKGSVAKFNRV